MQHQPAALNRKLKTGLVFVRSALLAVQEWPVDQFDVDPPFLPNSTLLAISTILRAAFSGSE